MKYKLFLDTSDQKKAIVRLYNGNEIICEKSDVRALASQVLLPIIDQICAENNISMKVISEIEVNAGPGSYTGLKVGTAVANALGFYLKVPINGKINIPVLPVFD